MYQIIINNQIIKEYKYKEQVMAYLLNNGYIYEGHGWFRGWLFKDERVKVNGKRI